MIVAFVECMTAFREEIEECFLCQIRKKLYLAECNLQGL